MRTCGQAGGLALQHFWGQPAGVGHFCAGPSRLLLPQQLGQAKVSHLQSEGGKGAAHTGCAARAGGQAGAGHCQYAMGACLAVP